MSTRLTPREQEVLLLLARGCTYDQVSDQLEVSANTIASHVKNIYRKLEVHSARRAIWRALELRLLGGNETTTSAPQTRNDQLVPIA